MAKRDLASGGRSGGAKRKRAAAASRYKPHPMLARDLAYAAKLEAETGATVQQLLADVRATGLTKAAECRKWLVANRGLSGYGAMWIAHCAMTNADPGAYDDPEVLVAALYSGSRRALLPTHDAVVDMANSLGDDVTVTSCKTMVPIYRKHVFAELRPTAGGVEVQLALDGTPPKGRLRRSEGRMPDDRLTHAVCLTSPADVDAEFKGWLAAAYAAGATKRKRASSAETPTDLALALKKSGKASATWATCTPAMQRDLVLWITSAKQAETRTRRVAQAIAKLAEGKRRAY